MKNKLTIALPKGRLGDQTIEVLKRIGLGDGIDDTSRKLIFTDQNQEFAYMLVKPSDVITYVERGVADLGIIGKDSLMEDQADVYELIDLGFGKCRFAVAGKTSIAIQKDEVLKIATKYPNVTKAYFEKKNQPIDIIKLNGSVELAPLVGLSDVIVDIVETGSTLKANGLEILEVMHDISARLIANRVSYRFKYEKITRIKNALWEVISWFVSLMNKTIVKYLIN
ncbi:MAG: ATP phosphoribosyltransferase [Acholeplasma sp.]|nr:MAG: ATP phosphoribosyltransferase [Acholeplasma sp.]